MRIFGIATLLLLWSGLARADVGVAGSAVVVQQFGSCFMFDDEIVYEVEPSDIPHQVQSAKHKAIANALTQCKDQMPDRVSDWTIDAIKYCNYYSVYIPKLTIRVVATAQFACL